MHDAAVVAVRHCKQELVQDALDLRQLHRWGILADFGFQIRIDVLKSVE
jgi:hypothetical protein